MYTSLEIDPIKVDRSEYTWQDWALTHDSEYTWQDWAVTAKVYLSYTQKQITWKEER